VTIVCPAITVSPPTFPNGTAGTPYSQTITASGGTAPYTFVVTNGVLPTGLTLSLDGTLSGTPTKAGSFTFIVTAFDANGCRGSQSYTITITSPGVIATIPVGSEPLGVGVNPNTNRIYISNFNSNTVSVINGATNAVVATISVGTNPRGLGVNPATNR